MVNANTNKKVAVGLSGGVDSSVSAYLLKEQGYDVTGVFMQCWDAKADGCKADEDRNDAVKVAAKLGIKFESLDFIAEYKSKVIEYFYAEYRAGRTPNPDVMCNKEIKFGMFLEWAMRQGFDYVATGHYARVEATSMTYVLKMGFDAKKDQSYFLYTLGQRELSKVLFPIGALEKPQVRAIAKEQGLHTFDKRDSVGICFIGEVDIKEFLKKEIDVVSGNVVNSSGEVIGTHDGAELYTVGQRHGFVINKYVGLPMYVTSKNVEKNEIIVGFVSDVCTDAFEVGELSWIDGIGPINSSGFECTVRIRHLGELYSAKVTTIKPSKASNALSFVQVQLEDPIFGVAPGQSAVFYEGDVVLGGGVIHSSLL